MRDVELGHIVKGRHTTIATHLQHFLSFIGKDTKLKELERTDCENYFYHRHKATNGNVKQVTVQNEQSTINALMKWLQRRCEMKSCDELKAEMEAIQQQMVEAKKNERANALKEVKRLCKEFGFTAGMLNGSLAEGRKAKEK